MTQENKELLFKDLSARLPHGVKVSVSYGFGQPEIKKLCVVHISQLMGNSCTIKPYLRPMSSMTEEELNDYLSYCDKDDKDIISTPRYHGIDWLNANHFDYRGLIPKGLALVASEGMYKIN